jgi:hypothetical protein
MALMDFVFGDDEERRQRNYRRFFNTDMTPFAFKEAFRLSATQVEFILEEIAPALTTPTERNVALSAKEKVGTTPQGNFCASAHFLGNHFFNSIFVGKILLHAFLFGVQTPK